MSKVARVGLMITLGALTILVLGKVYAQQPVNVVLARDANTLTLYVPPQATISLQGLRFDVITDSGIITKYLHDYASFALIKFPPLPSPICFRFVRAGTENPLFEACPPSATLTHEISDADVFWYDLTRNLHRTIVVSGNTMPTGVICANAAIVCEIVYVPPTFTPTVPTPTPNTATLTAMYAVPTATPTPTITPTPAMMSLKVSELTLSLICVQTGDTIQVQAKGTIRVGQWVGTVDPDGTEDGAFGVPLGDGFDLVRKYPHGALMCRVEGEKDWRLCGTEAEFTAPSNGCLEFEINDNDQGANSGEFTVVVDVQPGVNLTATSTP
ncbi:MAG TPA: hypothetical protein VHO69_11855 [Phototrophicaceae bacterium]|nr:hypothetical protein [Phototrophicaceae bacterium]